MVVIFLTSHGIRIWYLHNIIMYYNKYRYIRVLKCNRCGVVTNK